MFLVFGYILILCLRSGKSTRILLITIITHATQYAEGFERLKNIVVNINLGPRTVPTHDNIIITIIIMSIMHDIIITHVKVHVRPSAFEIHAFIIICVSHPAARH